MEGQSALDCSVTSFSIFLDSVSAHFFDLFSQLFGSQPILYNIFSTLFITYSRLIFDWAFFAIAKRLRISGIKMDYITISAFGFILLFIANQILLLSSASYPPFGLAAVIFLGLSCYMVLIGIYSSAISISQNAKLRNAIKKLIEKKSNLLDSIGATQMSQFLEKEIFAIYNNVTEELNNKSGITPSLSSIEARNYCDEVIEEIEKSRSVGTKHES
jgi:hypothetical protein